MTKTGNFRGKFDESLVIPKYVCVLRNCTLIYHAEMCVKCVARDQPSAELLSDVIINLL